MRHESFDRDLSGAGSISRAELVAALSYALDLTEGQPDGHCVRACWIGMQIGKAMQLDRAELDDLYYAILLKDLGCSSNSARIAELYLTDDRSFKASWKTVPTGLPATLRFVIDQTAAQCALTTRVRTVGKILRQGDRFAQEMIEARCTRGAAIASSMHFSPDISRAIYSLDEHWDGSGRPDRLKGAAIPLASRIALLAQVADVFHQAGGREAARREVANRCGSWFDPALCEIFEIVSRDADFWAHLEAEDIETALLDLAPANKDEEVDEDFLDDIAAAFGQVVDAKSSYTHGHSMRVAVHARAIAKSLGLSPARQRWIYRGALLHDIGKLAISNRILDKPGALDAAEWKEMHGHAVYTDRILSKISVLSSLAPVAAAHHERLDGAGYPLGLKAEEIALETRIISICDYYDALTAERPQRPALRRQQALDVLAEGVGSSVDPACFEALKACVAEDPDFTHPRHEKRITLPFSIPKANAAR